MKTSFQLSYTIPNGRRIPVFIFDNHNHAFFFWHQALSDGKISEKAKLVHIDAHTDLNSPPYFLPTEQKNNLEKIFEYTNFVLNVGNFILPAVHTGCIDSEIIMVNTENALQKFTPEKISLTPKQSIILDIDLDFWNEELLNIGTEKGVSFTRQWLLKADLVTVATSPFFLEQARALEILHKILPA